MFKRECKRGLVREIEIKWESEREREKGRKHLQTEWRVT